MTYKGELLFPQIVLPRNTGQPYILYIRDGKFQYLYLKTKKLTWRNIRDEVKDLGFSEEEMENLSTSYSQLHKRIAKKEYNGMKLQECCYLCGMEGGDELAPDLSKLIKRKSRYHLCGRVHRRCR